MKTRVLIIFAIGIVGISASAIPIVYAQCLVNEDWPDAPCLDGIINGHYPQKDVNRWAEYYQYKGTVFMEQKRSELDNAIQENSLQGWADRSIQNRNVYEYYFFSGRDPNTGEYYGQFDEFMIKESSTIHDPYTDDERYQLANKVPLGGLGINPQFDLVIIVIGIALGFGIAISMMVYWRKRK
jgi:hypothetical protein